MSADGGSRRTLTDQAGWNTSASFSPSGGQVVFMSNREGDSEIFLLDLEGSAGLVQLTDTPGYDNTPRFSPDGKRIVFSSDRRGFTELFLMEKNGEGQRPLVEKSSLPGQDFFEKEPCWEPVVNY
jgi:Tol biopolymer transport system component